MTSTNRKKDQAYDRHRQLMKAYLERVTAPKAAHVPSTYKTQKDILHENHKFVRSDLDDDSSWGQRVAKKYYDRLFKEYALCDLKYYRESRIALRWRTEKEVVVGKGQFICASTRCDATDALTSWEVNFGYMEEGEKKNELVKVRLCVDCSDKLNYQTKKRKAKRKRQAESEKEEEEEEEEVEKQTKKRSKKTEQKEEDTVWSKPLESQQEKSKEEEYEDYFADLLE
ncbi:folate-sensitive fragile site protein Fra10Ac1-domain-containing protein [Blakeslea trispora]|nr:folate-sensitive fragile site protein Fra10Ac1-domain-containing protein [Blakeslea trispora]